MGHNILCSHEHSKFKIGNSAQCTFSDAQQTWEHILQECSNYDTLRITDWPMGTPVNAELYGTKQELLRFIQFIQEATWQM